MISRQAFIDQHKHELSGLLLEALMNRERQGGELAMWVRLMMMKLDARLGVIYDQLAPKTVDPVGPVTSPNGSAKAKV